MSAQKFALKASVVVESGSGHESYVVFDSHSASMFSCNEPAFLLLEHLKGGVSQAELAEAIVREYAVTREVAERDAGQFLRNLSVAGFLDERT